MRQQKLAATTLGVMLAVALAAVDVAAQEHHYDAKWTLPENEEARAHIQKGDELVGSGDYAEARRHYEAAAEVIRSAGDFPGLAVHREAAAFYYQGMYQSAISTLNDLAEEATRYGDVVTQLWALADAAWIQGKRGQKIDMERTVDRIHLLLKSPYLPQTVRREVTSKRLGEATTLTAES